MKKLSDELKKITGHLSSSKYGYNKRYPYTVQTTMEGVPQEIVLWMVENLEHGWGWYWREQTEPKLIILKYVIFSFEKDEEAVLFKLAHKLK